VAFSKQPDIATYKTQMIPLVREYNSRSTGISKDVDFQNVVFEHTKNRASKEDYVDIKTRPGIAAFSATLQSTVVRGFYYWKAQGAFYVWVDNDIKIINESTGAISATVSNVLSTSTGDVGVTEFLYDSGAVKLVFTDGVDICTIDSANTVVTSADADRPTPLLPTIVFLDGYLFCVDSQTQDIINSNLNDPLAFTAGDFISAEMVPDTMLGIAKLNNYLIAFGVNSIEYFWDAANATGSPLQRNDTPVKFNGLLNDNSIAVHGNKLYFSGVQREGSPGVYVLEDFKIKELGDDSLRRQLLANATFASFAAAIVSTLGHDYYVLSAGVYTYAIDLDQPELWTRWAGAGLTNLSILFASNTIAASTYKTVIYIVGDQVLKQLDNTITTDMGTSYTMTIVTGMDNFDSYNQKVINRLTVVGDRPTADTTLSISWTDNDYQSYQTAQTVNLNQELPCIYQCGPFRRRAHKITCSPTVPFRLRGLEVDINLGNS
jgi:hypothetical protein